jgi:O-antigen biosynthesis protein
MLTNSAAMPRITVAIPAYKSRFIATTLQSAISQDFEDFEILICDDCPDDAVANAIAPLLDARRGPQIRYLRNPRQLHEVGNYAKCIEQARGTYVKLLCDDDLLLPGCLSAMAQVLERRPDVTLVTSRRHLIDEQGNRLQDAGYTMMPFRGDTCVCGPELVSFLGQRTFNFIGEPTSVMFRREQMLPHADALFSIGHQPIAWLGDLTMHVKLLREGHLAMLEQALSCLRISCDQVSHSGRLAPGIGDAGHADFKRMIGEMGWLRATDNHLVGVRPLWSKEPFAAIDLGQRVDRMMRNLPPLDHIARWLDQRVFSPAQAQLASERLQHTPAAIAVFVRQAGKPAEATALTLASLAALPSFAAPARVIVLDRAAADPPQDVALSPPGPALSAAPPQALLAIATHWLSDCQWLMLVDAGTEFLVSGMAVLAQELAGTLPLRAVYADEIIRGHDGELTALLRPDFNLDLLLSMPSSMAGHWLYRRDVFVAAGGLDPAFAEAAELDLLLRLINSGGFHDLGHVHEPLLIAEAAHTGSRQAELDALTRHLDMRGYTQATIASHLPGGYRIHYGHQVTPAVSIIVVVRNQLEVLLRCIGTLLEKTAYRNYELLIVDHGNHDHATRVWLDGVEAMAAAQVRVLRCPTPSNPSVMNNFAARHARGDYLLLLEDDTATLREDWLDAMLNHALRQEVGIVGAKLLSADGRVHHAGMVLGLRGPADSAFVGEQLDAAGYMCRLQVDQDYSAVSSACLMVRKALYLQVGGLDEQAFAVSYHDVDLCLKVRQAGYLIVWTPHALLLQEGGAKQDCADRSAEDARQQRLHDEQAALYRRWLPQIARDPAYNLNLALYGNGFQVETDTTTNWHPLTWRPRPVTLAQAADLDGSGHYRIIQPTLALQRLALAEAHWVTRYQSPAELERLSPDVLILQRHFLERDIRLQRRSYGFNRAFKVAELDDYLPNLPRKSGHRALLPKDVVKTMRKALTLADRFVVSTPALAEALDGMHADIRVIENRLPPAWWQQVQGRRRQGTRPRVGWGGGGSHRGDLELIADVVRSLANEVEWVFLGMCPEALRPFVHEFHLSVPIDNYPARLANLDLDLALAPLEDNLFNQCKSNLRLLEYGACGFPVVCSDVRPYRCDLPVTRVKPRHKDWVAAIRMHTRDLDAAAQAGDALRAAVQRDWMLDEAYAAHWLSQWTPD